MATPCLQCGRDIPAPERARSGNPIGCCSKECRRIHRSNYKREWDARNSEYLAEYFRAKRKEQKAEHPDYFKNYYAANAERRKLEARAWYRANPERHAERQRAYDAKRPVELMRALRRKNRAKRRTLEHGVFIEAVDPRVVFDRDKGVCGICRQPVEADSQWEIDHRIPISKGGLHCYLNVQLAHRKCNRQKWASLPTSQPPP